MFQLPLVRALLPFTYQRPALPALFKLPLPSQETYSPCVPNPQIVLMLEVAGGGFVNALFGRRNPTTPNCACWFKVGGCAPSRLRDSPLLGHCAASASTREPRAEAPEAAGKGVEAAHKPKASKASVVQAAHAQPFMGTSAQAARVLRICHASGLRGASALTKQQAASV